MNRREFIGEVEFQAGSKWKLNAAGRKWNGENHLWNSVHLFLFSQIRLIQRDKIGRFNPWMERPDILWWVSTSDTESPSRHDHLPVAIIRKYYEPL